MVICDGIHGFAEVPWDYNPIPQRVWDALTVLPNDCWVAPTRKKARSFQNMVVERITRRSAFDALAITPTCGNQRCCNPGHLCLAWANAMSGDE